MRALLLVFALIAGFFIGVFTERKAVQSEMAESPWPRPTPTPGIDWEEENRKVDQMKCDAEKAQIAIDCKILWTGKPSPPRE